MPNTLNGELCHIERVIISWCILDYNSDHVKMQSRNLAVIKE